MSSVADRAPARADSTDPAAPVAPPEAPSPAPDAPAPTLAMQALPAPAEVAPTESQAPPTLVDPPAVQPAQPLPRRRASIPFLIVVTVVSLAADLASKGWAKGTLSSYDTKVKGLRKFEVIKHHLDFIFAQNPGGAWSFLRSMPDGLRRPFFLVVSAAAIVFIISIYRRVYDDHKAMKWGLPLALGGAMGNLVDRIRYGWVVDFVDVYITRGGREHHWPTFNVADIAIVIGVGLMAIDMLRTRGARFDAPESQRPVETGSAPVPPAAS